MLFRRSSSKAFKARSSERDLGTDAARAAAVGIAIDKMLAEAENEKAGLMRRLADVVARASLTIGNDADEYLTRDALSNDHQSSFSADIKYAERRLQELDDQIGKYLSLKESADMLFRSKD